MIVSIKELEKVHKVENKATRRQVKVQTLDAMSKHVPMSLNLIGQRVEEALINLRNYIDAAMQAAKLRFRAVMMTNIAFILGLLPLVFAHGAGAGSRHSIGVSVFGGMIAVAFLGSILVPAFFVAINVMKEKTEKYLISQRNNN